MQFRTMTLLAFMSVALLTRAGDAQTSRPTDQTSGAAAISSVATTKDAASATIIRRSGDATATTRPAGTLKATSAFDTTRVVLSLGIVLTLILALRWMFQRLFGKTVASRSSRAVQVLSRNIISPKQQLLVVQVGRRLVVVGDSGQQMNPLCEITDPDEMAALIGQIHEEKRESTAGAFGSIFGRAGSAFEKDHVEPQRPVDVAEDEDDSADNSTGPSRDVQQTRDELSGLMDKVRVMSRQFRRT